MRREKALFLPIAPLGGPQISYHWDDWDPYALIPTADDRTTATLARVTDHAKFAFALGCAEWAVARLDPWLPTPDAWDYIDACWAYEVSADFGVPPELDDDEWEGPVLGPVGLSLITILNTRYGFDEDNAEYDSAFAEQIALYVLGKSADFYVWRNLILERLQDCFPRTERDRAEERLAKQVIDPTVSFDKSVLPTLRKETLRNLHLDGNKFVRKIA
jgi:hypothetical protein